MIVSIHQPAYLPWLGYVHRIAMSDVHVVLDNVQFEKNSFINRNKVRTPDGWCWLTVPVKTAGKFGNLPINEVEIANDRDWAAKHWNTLRLNYARAPYFDRHAAFFESIYRRQWNKLSQLNREITDYVIDAFGFVTRCYRSSELKVGGSKDDLVLNLCRELGTTVYLSGPLGRNYLRPELFQEAGIEIRYHDFEHPRYAQVYAGFEPYMAALDLLFNAGPESLEILTGNQELIAQ